MRTLLLFVVLAIAPIAAAWRLSAVIDWRWITGIAALLSAISASLYAVDKRRARTAARRIPESTLHLSALVGGWPGALLAQRLVRHKTRKASFQVVFWCIVAAHQLVAVDCAAGWAAARWLAAFVRD
ncbi:DUF1294 domain-containing protein [Congregicoccus parvus]|uniref:DUF1294 domain-containing protein n=1 Tax=Congregicoccus parvus TaxID=3081749 RepID=UPI003FA53CA0